MDADPGALLRREAGQHAVVELDEVRQQDVLLAFADEIFPRTAPAGSREPPHPAGTDAGLFLLPQTAVVFVFGAIAGRISAAIGSARAVLIGVLLAAGSFGLLAIGYSRVWQILAATIMLGAAVGLTYSGMPNVIVESVPPDQTGVATGMNAHIRTLGSALGGQVTMSIVTTTIVSTGIVSTGIVSTGIVSTGIVSTGIVSTGIVSTGIVSTGGFTISFAVLAVACLGAAVVAAGVQGHRPSG